MIQRIALITDWYAPRRGGLEIYLDGLARNLQVRGLDVTVLTPVPGPATVNGVPVQRLCGTGDDGGYRFPPAAHASNWQDFLYLLDLFAGSRQPRIMERLSDALEQGQYRVAHVHLGNTPFAYLAVNVCRALGVPVVATFHSNLSALERPIANVAARLLCCRRWRNDIVLSSVSSTAAANRAIMFGDAPFQVLHNALDTTWTDDLRARREQVVRDKHPIALVAVLRLHARKRPMALVKAMTRLVAVIPDRSAVRLRIAGEGPMRWRLKQEIAKRGLDDVVELCGQLSRASLGDLLARSDLFLAPTKLESFGIAALEARSAGLPVLALRSAGSVDFLTDMVDSIIVGDDAQFTRAMIGYVTSAEQRLHLAQGAARPVIGFAWHDLVNKCLAAYQQAEGLRAAAKDP